MSSTNRALLTRALTGLSSERLVQGAMQTLEHFFQTADEGCLRLQRPETVRREQVAVCLSLAIGEPVDAVIPVCPLRPFPHPECLSNRQYALACNGLAGESLAIVLKDEAFRRDLSSAVNDHLLNGLRNALDQVSWYDRGQNWSVKLHDLARNAILVAVRRFLAATIRQDVDAMHRLSGLLREMQYTIPICRQADEPRRWLTVTAAPQEG